MNRWLTEVSPDRAARAQRPRTAGSGIGPDRRDDSAPGGDTPTPLRPMFHEVEFVCQGVRAGFVGRRDAAVRATVVT